MSTNELTVIAELVAAPGRREELIAILAPLFDAAADEPGTLGYAMYLDVQDKDTVWFHERYESKEALLAHGASQVLAQVTEAMTPVLARPADIRVTRAARSI